MGCDQKEVKYSQYVIIHQYSCRNNNIIKTMTNNVYSIAKENVYHAALGMTLNTNQSVIDLTMLFICFS